MTVSEQVYSHSDTTRDCCFTCGKDHSLVSCDQFLKSSVTKRRQAIYNYGACYKCFKANHLAKNCPTKIKCHHCDAPHHPLLCKLGDGVHSSDETNTSNLITAPPLRVKIGVWVLSAVGLTRLSMFLGRNLVLILWHLVVIAERNDSVYTNLNVPPNYARDSGQERQDSLQHLVSHNNINVSLAKRQTVSGDRTDEETVHLV